MKLHEEEQKRCKSYRSNLFVLLHALFNQSTHLMSSSWLISCNLHALHIHMRVVLTILRLVQCCDTRKRKSIFVCSFQFAVQFSGVGSKAWKRCWLLQLLRKQANPFSTEIYFQFQNKTELTYRDWLKSQTCVSLFYPCSEIHPPPHFVRQKSRWIWRWTTIRYVKLHD